MHVTCDKCGREFIFALVDCSDPLIQTYIGIEKSEWPS